MKYTIPALVLAALMTACSTVAEADLVSSSAELPSPSSVSDWQTPAAGQPQALSSKAAGGLTDAVRTKEDKEKEKAKKPQVTLSSENLALGEVLVLHVENAKGLDVSGKTDLPHQPQFFEDGGKMTALQPVAYTTPTGNYNLTITVGKQSFHYTIAVTDREFQIQQLQMSQSTAEQTALSQQANLEWEQKVEPLKPISTPEKYWEGAFMQPVAEYSSITTEYGAIRYTNGSKVPSRHSGIDFASKRGTQAVAANSGKILFADYLQLTGYTVVIDHGFGLKSFYYHMDSLDTQPGAWVNKGDPVGKVGSTGYSTGPHLHYSLLVNNIFINPWTAFEKGYE